MRISDWSSDVCSADLEGLAILVDAQPQIGVAFADIGTRRRPPAAEEIAVVVELERRGTGQRVHQRRVGDHIVARLAVDAERARIDRMFPPRSEERRVGKECVITFRSGWSPYSYKQPTQSNTDFS